MLQAAASGVIDFSHVDFDSSYDKIKVRLLLREVQKQNEVQLYNILHAQLAAQLSNSGLTQDSLEKVWKSTGSIYDHVKQLKFPWLKDEKETTKEEAAKYAGIKEVWANAFGDPDDPMIQAQIDATARWLSDGTNK